MQNTSSSTEDIDDLISPSHSLKHHSSKLDLLDSTTLTSFPIPHPINYNNSKVNKLKSAQSYSVIPLKKNGLNDIIINAKKSRNVTNVAQSSSIITPPSSTEYYNTSDYDYRDVLDQCINKLKSTSSIDKCDDAYLRSILTENNNNKEFGTLYYCSLCDAPLYELSGLIPDDMQNRELVCQGCSEINETRYENGYDACTVQIVDEMDTTLQSNEINTTVLINSPSPRANFELVISNLRAVSTKDLRLRNSMIDLNNESRSQFTLWALIKQRLFGIGPLA